MAPLRFPEFENNEVLEGKSSLLLFKKIRYKKMFENVYDKNESLYTRFVYKTWIC